MQRGSGNKVKKKYTSPIKAKMGKTDLFNPTIYQKGLRAQYLSKWVQSLTEDKVVVI